MFSVLILRNVLLHHYFPKSFYNNLATYAPSRPSYSGKLKVKIHPFWMLYCFWCISEQCYIDSLGQFMFPCVFEILPFKQKDIWPVPRSIEIKSLSLNWKWISNTTFRSQKRRSYMTSSKSDFSRMSHWSYFSDFPTPRNERFNGGYNTFLIFVCLRVPCMVPLWMLDCTLWGTSICRLNNVRL